MDGELQSKRLVLRAYIEANLHVCGELDVPDESFRSHRSCLINSQTFDAVVMDGEEMVACRSQFLPIALLLKRRRRLFLGNLIVAVGDLILK